MKSSDFLKDHLKDVAFLELNKETQQMGVVLPEGFYLPMLYDGLGDTVRTQSEMLKSENLIEGILYLFGLDPDFKEKELYRKLLSQVEEKLTTLLPLIVKRSKEDPKKALIMSLGYLHLELSDKTAYLLAAEISNLHLKESKDKRYEALSQEILEEAIQHAPSWEIRYHLGFIYYNQNRFEEAKLLFNDALEESEGDFKDEILEMLALCEEKKDYEKALGYLFSERIDEAITILETLKPSFEDWYDLHFFLGLAYRLKNEFRRSLSVYQEALNLKRDDSNLYNEMAICHMMLAEYTNAEPLLLAALELDAKASDVMTNLGLCYSEMGQKEDAKRYLEEALQLNPKDEIAKNSLDKLSQDYKN